MKGIVILIIVILVLGGILAFRVFNPEINIFPQAMSKEEVRQLLEKGTQVDNYIAKYKKEIDNKEQEVTRIVKGNTIILKTDTLYTWDNLETKEQYIISYDKKVALFTKDRDKSGIVKNTSKGVPEQVTMISLIDDAQYEYKYIKKEKVKENRCIVIELKRKYEAGEYSLGIFGSNENAVEIKCKIWIDENTGMILKAEAESIEESGEKNTTAVEYDVQWNVVKDEDVEKPNLDGYEIVDLDAR